MMSCSIHQALHQAKIKNIERLDAEVLLAFVIKKPRSIIYSSPEYTLTNDEWIQYKSYLMRRFRNEPLAYILGTKEFWSLELSVNENTLIPRSETELLIATILDLFDHSESVLADIGTGSGAIAIVLAKERPHWQIHASDISSAALKVAKQNAKTHKVDRIHFYLGHLLSALPTEIKFDMIVANLPYLTESEWLERQHNLGYEPKRALVYGQDEDGLAAMREVISAARFYLKPCGYLFLEHGFLQGKSLSAILTAEDFSGVQTLKDLAGLERISYGRLKGRLKDFAS